MAILSIISSAISFISQKLTLILLGALGLLIVSFGGYYLYADSKISGLEKANVEMSIAIKAQESTIKTLQKANKNIQAANAKIRANEGRARARAATLESQLKNVFQKNATNEQIAKEVRQIEQDRLRCFEIITGSERRETDKANSICP